MTTTTALALIKGSLRRINSYQSGDPIAAPDSSDCLETLNDLLDSLSLDSNFILGSNEFILSWTAGQKQYTIGNPTNAELSGANSTGGTFAQTWPNIVGIIGCNFLGQTATNVLTVNSVLNGAIFVGDIIPALSPNTQVLSFGTGTGGTGTYNLTTTPGTVAAEGLSTRSATIASVTSIPSNLVAGTTAAYQVGSGSILSDSMSLIAAGATVTAFNAAAGTITMSIAAAGTTNGINDSIGYSVPGNFPIPRPLRITGGFTRFNNLDFLLDLAETQEQYISILYKAQPGPWPTVAWCNTGFPYHVLNVYQQPGNNAELHLFCDSILANVTLNQNIMLPQGYARCLKWLLAKELCAEFGFPLTEAIKTNAYESMQLIETLNAQPTAVSNYDRALTRGNRGDAGWIFSGGYG